MAHDLGALPTTRHNSAKHVPNGLLPGLERRVRWTETWGGRKACLTAIPAEELNSVDVYHIGENGYVHGPPEFDRFPGQRLDGLLESWLSWVRDLALDWEAPSQVELEVPRFVGGDVVYERVSLEPTPGPSVSLSDPLLRRPDRLRFRSRQKRR